MQFQQRKRLRELIKMERKLQEIYLTYYNLLTEQDLWQDHYQILPIIFIKEFIKLHVNTDTMIKNVKLLELHTKYATIFLNTQTLKMIYWNANVYVVTKTINKFDENLKERFLSTYKLSKYNKHNFIFLLQKIVHPYEYLDDWEVSMKIQ